MHQDREWTRIAGEKECRYTPGMLITTEIPSRGGNLWSPRSLEGCPIFSATLCARGELAFRLQLQRCGVHTVPQPRWTRSIRKNMAEMSIAAAAKHFNAAHAVFVVFFGCDAFLANRPVKTRPTTSGFVLRVGAEQLLAAADAGISSRSLLRVVLSCKWRLGSALARHSELIISQLRAPLGVALANLFRHADPN